MTCTIQGQRSRRQYRRKMCCICTDGWMDVHTWQSCTVYYTVIGILCRGRGGFHWRWAMRLLLNQGCRTQMITQQRHVPPWKWDEVRLAPRWHDEGDIVISFLLPQQTHTEHGFKFFFVQAPKLFPAVYFLKDAQLSFSFFLQNKTKSGGYALSLCVGIWSIIKLSVWNYCQMILLCFKINVKFNKCKINQETVSVSSRGPTAAFRFRRPLAAAYVMTRPGVY